MSMLTTKVDFSGATALASRLDALSDRALLQLSAIDAVNEVTLRVDAQARKAMNAGINLSDAYISSKTTVRLASGKSARAEITMGGDLTILGHYPYQQLRQAGTPLRKGPSRGRRPSGVVIEIKRGEARYEPQWFTMRLREGTRSGDKVGVFVRTSAGGVKHIYGASPYSLFRYQIGAQEADWSDDLERTATQHAVDALKKALA
jgi:hypothetical protein